MNNILILVGKIKRGKNRLRIFKAIDKPLMPSELVINIYGKQSNTYFNSVSRALAELKQLGLIKIINPEEKTGRIYQLTELGKKIKSCP
ncbi:MAG: hypothetical protein KKG75_02330 [Nanoarchaeota archaeon]|nr:hypothetical protein [Nanoarchaeota archaeon]